MLVRLLAPLINDISTDLDDPPTFSESGSVKNRPLSDKVIAATRKHYSDLGTLRLGCDSETAFRKVLEAAELMSGWKLTVIDRDEQRLEGYAVTSILRFRDDFVVRVRGDDDGASVDMRSRSRAGKGDFGANAERIRAFFAKLQELTGR